MYPAEILGITDTQYSKTKDEGDSVVNYNTGGAGISVPGSKKYSLTFPATKVNANAGLATAELAFDDEAFVYICVLTEVTADQDKPYYAPDVLIANCSITDASTTSPATGYQEVSLAFSISGEPIEGRLEAKVAPTQTATPSPAPTPTS